MKKKLLIILVIIIILISGIAILTYLNSENEISKLNLNDSNYELKGEKIAINGLNTMISENYSNGTIKTSPGIETYGKYEEDNIYITVYDQTPQGDKVYQGDIDYFAYGIANKDKILKKENITLYNQTFLYVSLYSENRGEYSLVFFKVNDQKVLIEWLGSDITPDIENIIYGFYKLN